MNRNELEKLGEELRGIGHRRRELAEQIFEEVQERDNQTSKSLYQELSDISDQAIDIITRQKEMFDYELQNM